MTGSPHAYLAHPLNFILDFYDVMQKQSNKKKYRNNMGNRIENVTTSAPIFSLLQQAEWDNSDPPGDRRADLLNAPSLKTEFTLWPLKMQL